MENFRLKFKKYLEFNNGLDILLRSLNDTSAISVSDKDANILEINENFLRIFKCTRDEIIGINAKTFYSPDHPAAFYENLKQTVYSKNAWTGEFKNLTKNKEPIWFNTTIAPILDDNNEIKYLISIRNDVTELKRKEEEIWQQLQFQAYINNHSTNIILKTELDGTIIYANNAFYQKFDYSSFEVLFVKRPDSFLDKESIEKKKNEFRDKLCLLNSDFSDFDLMAINTTKSLKNDYVWEMLTKNKTKKVFKLNINYYYDRNEVPQGYLIVGEDVSEQRQLESDIERVKFEYQNILRLKNEFMGRLSHEIKTPLNGILGMLSILDGTELNSEQRDNIEIAENSANRLLALIDKTIELNKLESKNILLHENHFSINELIDQLELKYKNRAEINQLQFKIIKKAAIDSFYGDEKRIKQILNYYLENAFKYTVEGEISFKIYSEGSILNFEVRDTGKGISKEKLDLIFRKDDGPTYSGNLSLSLEIVKRLASFLNAEVGVKSSEGHGSLFYLKLKIKEEQHVLIPETKQETFLELKEIKVLIAEDESINQRLLKKLLNKLNLFPDVVANGLEVLEWQKENKAELIFMDVNMPVMDGLEATKIIRSNNEMYGNPIIIAVTANSVVGDEEACIEAGMNSYIPKPINRDRLGALLQKLIGEKEEANIATKNKRKFFVERLIEDFKGDEEILLDFIHQIIDNLPLRLEKLEQAVLNNQYDQVKFISHALADLMKSIHQDELYEMFKVFEEYGFAKKKKNILPLLKDIKKITLNMLSDLQLEFYKEVS